MPIPLLPASLYDPLGRLPGRRRDGRTRGYLPEGMTLPPELLVEEDSELLPSLAAQPAPTAPNGAVGAARGGTDDMRYYRRRLEEALNNPPQRPKPGIGQSLAAAAIGGLGGWLNSSASRAVHQDPRMLQETQDRLLYGDYPEQMSLYQQRLKGLGNLAELETKEAIDKPYKEAMAEQAKSRADYLNTAEQRAMNLQEKKTEGTLKVEEKKSANRLAVEALRNDANKRKFIVSTKGLDPEYLKEHGLEEEEEIDVRPYQVWSRMKISSADRDSEEKIAKRRDDLKKLGLDRDYEMAKARLADTRRRTDAYVQSKKEEGKKDFKPEIDYVRDMGRAESEHVDNLESLYKRYKIGAGFDTSTPEQLAPEQRMEFYKQRGELERKLLERKNQLERLYAGRVGKKPDEIVDFAKDHAEAISTFDAKAGGGQPQQPQQPRPSTPPSSAKPASKGTINLKDPLTRQKFQQRAKSMGLSEEAAIAAAATQGYKVER